MSIKDFLNFRKWLFCGLLNPAKDSWLYKVADCQRYEEEEYVTVNVCSKNPQYLYNEKWCESAVEATFPKGQEPTAVCIACKPLDVQVTVCKVTGMKARTSCRMTETKIFPQPEAPTKFCNVHKLPTRNFIKDFDHDGLGLFLDFLDHAWNPDDQPQTEQRIMNYLGKIAHYGVNRVSFFSYLHTNRAEHKHLNWKIPWTKSGNKFDFTKPSERYAHLRDRFLEMLSIAKLKPQPILEMDRYTTWGYENNVNGITDFWTDPKARAIQIAYAVSWYNAMRKYWENKDIYIVPVNEPAHGGNDAKGHLIANYHKEIWLSLETYGFLLKNFMVDISLSEFSRAQLVYHGVNNKCPKCDRPWDNIEEYDRLCIGINHSVSITADLEEGHKSFSGFLGSGNNTIKWTEDGSSNPLCNGFVMGGDYGWRLGSAAQVKEMLVYTWGTCKTANRRRVFIWGIYPMEQFHIRDWGLQSEYSIERVDWSRFEAVVEADKQING